MRFINKNLIIFIIIIIFLPILIKSYNLKLIYDINTIKKDIKKIEIENQYLKKRYYSISSLARLNEKARSYGFKTPEPYTIIILEDKKEHIPKNLIAKIKNRRQDS